MPGMRRVGPYLPALRAALVVAPVWGAWVGLVLTWQFVSGLAPFHSERLAPVMVALAVLRSGGPHAGLLATTVVATIVLHRAGRRDPTLVVDHARGAVLLGVATFLAYTLVSLGALLASAAWMRGIGHAQPVFAGVREPGDVGFGLGLALALGAASIPVWRAAGPRASTSPWGLASKLFVAVLAVNAVACLSGAVIGAVVGLGDPTVSS